MLKQIWVDESGQGMVEYGLILALVSVVAVAALRTVGTKVQGTLNSVDEALPTVAEPELP